jgi:hypothetical protein
MRGFWKKLAELDLQSHRAVGLQCPALPETLREPSRAVERVAAELERTQERESRVRGVAVLLDALLIRLLLLLLPVLLRVMGARAWYLPRWARRVLPDVRFGHS